MKKEKKELSPFIETMLKKLDEKEVAKPQSLVMDTDKDPELKPYMIEKDQKKIEEHIKKMKENIK
ncbi:hypothetical protein J4446_01320 [Candidatus Woesearchaeota archaeon]|nr:hypothetical protein [Candidatus Woesearchaeota archaeon]